MIGRGLILTVRAIAFLPALWGGGVLLTPVWNLPLSPTGVRLGDPSGSLEAGLPWFTLGVGLWAVTVCLERSLDGARSPQ